MEKQMNIVAWKLITDANKNCVYKLQVEAVSSRDKKKVLAELEGWKEVGYGWNDKKEICLFSRSFQDKESFIQWAKQFPFELKEVNRNGKEKKIN
tara:strand:+ start:471 stop:755 length:285 start_codon:yes stop_codon:yes gene_type:complete